MPSRLLRIGCWMAGDALCWFAFQRAATVRVTVLPVQGGRFARPSPHSAYTYTPSGASPAQLASPGFGPSRYDPNRGRAWHLWSSSSRSVAPRPRSRSPRRLSRRLHGVTRRNASSAEYRLLALRRVPPRIRRTEPSRVAQLATRHDAPLPHYMLNPFKPTQQALTDAACSKVEIFDLRTVRPFRRSYTFSTNLFSSARRRAASASSSCMTAYSSNALDPPTCRAEALA